MGNDSPRGVTDDRRAVPASPQPLWPTDVASKENDNPVQSPGRNPGELIHEMMPDTRPVTKIGYIASLANIEDQTNSLRIAMLTISSPDTYRFLPVVRSRIQILQQRWQILRLCRLVLQHRVSHLPRQTSVEGTATLWCIVQLVRRTGTLPHNHPWAVTKLQIPNS